MNNLKNFGNMSALDNARRKAAILYDSGTIATGTTDYYLFTNPNLSPYLRNRNLPLSGSEIFLIDSINLHLNFYQSQKYSKNIFTLLKEAFVQIIVDEREKIKIPLIECASFLMGSYFGDGTNPYSDAFRAAIKYHKRSKKLQTPIIINANSNVTVKLILSSTNATNFNLSTFNLQLAGIKYDKLNDYQVDFLGNNSLERLSYSVYDVVTLSASEESLSLFADRNKAQTLFSKNLPLSDKEAFQIEAIEIFTQQNSTSPAGSLFESGWDELLKFMLEIVVDDVQIFQGIHRDMFGYGWAWKKEVDATEGAAYVTMDLNIFELITSTYVLPEPIIIPANSKVQAKLRHGALTYVSGNLLVVFKGTLIREVA